MGSIACYGDSPSIYINLTVHNSGKCIRDHPVGMLQNLLSN
jgi:hypothetical protein